MIAAVVPAAGRSVRMGRPKLLLPIQGATMLARVVTALCAGGVERVIVVTPPEVAPLGPELAAEARRAGAEVVVPKSQPAEMRDSIELGLEFLARGTPPRHVLFSPGDTPGITRDLVARLLECAARSPERIVVPCCEGRRGHPIVLPWDLALAIRSLPSGVGVNALVAREADHVALVMVEKPELIADVDTPDEFERWSNRYARRDPAVDDRRRSNHDTPLEPAASVRVQVRLFALAKERAGRPEIDLELAAPATVGGLRAAISRRVPELGPLMPNVLIAINEEYAADHEPIPSGARIAVIPPVSGGGSARSEVLCIQAVSRRSSRNDRDHQFTD
jgi:molybdenum cofactor cytidylyltransferase